jgi:hypothetical protein
MLSNFCRTFLALLIGINVWSQSTLLSPSDTLNNKRLIASAIGTGVIWSGSIIGLSSIWYKDFPKTSFHTFDDSREWMQMDKMGHVFTAYHLSDKVSKLYRWSGLDRKKSALIGAGVGWGYQMSFELLDAQSADWGFSWSDVGANTLGSGLFLSQELIWQEQYVKLKFSYSPSDFAQYRPSILGASFSERLLKDYNGQTYWLTFSPGCIFPKSKIPAWIAIAAGYSVDAKLVGSNDFFQTADGLKSFTAKREFVLSLDLDVTKLPIKKPWLKKVLSPFNLIKIPFPALVFRGNDISGRLLYF